ncbi:MAG: hypothetical protein KH828_03190 [Clostridiales bacterium]|nr:hypothetical protein [Clostridiales bacterium]
MDIKQKIKKIWKEKSEKRIYRIGGIAAGVLLLALAGKFTADHWSYKSYEVVTELVQEDTSSVKYTRFGENLLRYGGDDVTLMNRQGEVMWNEVHSMDNPVVDICQEFCVIYDKNGSTMSVFNMEGKVGDIGTTLPILKAKTAKQGVVAAILEDGETTWVNVYDSQGEEIVTAKTRVDSPGYPIDLSLSEDGLLMAVSYLGVKDHKPSSYVAFYNFGNTGQNQMDNMVSGYTYGETLVPQVKYLDDSTAVAFRDDGFVIFRGKQIPEEAETVEVKDDILSTFCDNEYIGLVFRDQEGEEPYRLELYDTNGRLKWTAGAKVAFDHIAISQDQILLYNSSEFAVYSMNGTCRYQGGFKEGSIRSMFKVSRNRYMVVTDSGIETIKLG